MDKTDADFSENEMECVFVFVKPGADNGNNTCKREMIINESHLNYIHIFQQKIQKIL